MDMVLFRQRIASTFLDTCGPHGAISEEARRRGVSRQSIYRESAKVQDALLRPKWQTDLEAAQRRVAELEERVACLEKQLADAVVLDEDKQAELASVGQAIGVSLPQTWTLLEVMLKERTPSVAKLGRWTKDTGERAGKLLQVLDEHAQPKVREGLIDEVYTKSPVLMVVEPDSMCWVGGRKSDEATGEAWQEELQKLPNLELVARDAGSGLTRGVKLLNEKRAEQDLAPVAEQLDHFHSLRDGGRGLGRAARAAKKALAKAEKTQKELDERRRQGKSLQGIGTLAASLWRKAERAMDVWSEQQHHWQKAKEALRLVTPEGELNTRERAEKELAQAFVHLPESDFGKSQRMLEQKETLTYLDQVHEKLDKLEAPAEVKQAAVRQECLRRRPELLQGESPQAATLRGVMLMCAVVLAKSGDMGKATAEAVRSIFRHTWRASSLVECLNSVVRMQQARHRKMTQGLLDLKRLHWNCHKFRTGRRRGQTPYQRLGLQLPPGVTWWELLKWPPEQLREELSALNMAA